MLKQSTGESSSSFSIIGNIFNNYNLHQISNINPAAPFALHYPSQMPQITLSFLFIFSWRKHWIYLIDVSNYGHSFHQQGQLIFECAKNLRLIFCDMPVAVIERSVVFWTVSFLKYLFTSYHLLYIIHSFKSSPINTKPSQYAKSKYKYQLLSLISIGPPSTSINLTPSTQPPPNQFIFRSQHILYYQSFSKIEHEQKQPMNNQSQPKIIRIQNEGYEYCFIYDPQTTLLRTNVRNMLTEEKAQNQFPYQALPNVITAIFENNQQLFAYLSTLPRERVAFQTKQNATSIIITLKLLGKDKLISLPVNHVTDNDAKIKEYQNKIQRICQDNRRLTVQLRTAEDNIESLTRELKWAKDKIQSLEQDLQILQIKSKKRSLSEFEPASPMLVPSKASLKFALDSTQYEQGAKIKENEKYRFVCEGLSLCQYFNIDGGRIKVKEQYKDFHQVVSNEPLDLIYRRVVRIKINQSSKNNIYFGILRESRRKEKFTCQHQHSISYKLCGGKFLFEDGRQSGEEIHKLKIGEVLCLVVDPVKKQMTWFVEKVFMFKRNLPNNFQNVPLFPFVSLHDLGDEVEFV